MSHPCVNLCTYSAILPSLFQKVYRRKGTGKGDKEDQTYKIVSMREETTLTMTLWKKDDLRGHD